MRISDWRSDVCSSDLKCVRGHLDLVAGLREPPGHLPTQRALEYLECCHRYGIRVLLVKVGIAHQLLDVGDPRVRVIGDARCPCTIKGVCRSVVVDHMDPMPLGRSEEHTSESSH